MPSKAKPPPAKPKPLPAKAFVHAKGTQREVARAIRYSEFHLSHVLNGLVRPGRKLREILAEYLGVPESELFDGDGRR
jgi:hypothetical protein